MKSLTDVAVQHVNRYAKTPQNTKIISSLLLLYFFSKYSLNISEVDTFSKKTFICVIWYGLVQLVVFYDTSTLIGSLMLNTIYIGLRYLNDVKSAAFRFQLEASCVFNHTKVLWYNKIVCFWMTIYMLAPGGWALEWRIAGCCIHVRVKIFSWIEYSGSR